MTADEARAELAEFAGLRARQGALSRDAWNRYTVADVLAEEAFSAAHDHGWDANGDYADRCICGGVFCPACDAHYPPEGSPLLPAGDPCGARADEQALADFETDGGGMYAEGT